jgi:Na+-transporting methylmalonyl-CoA/oxaloacetate decarboxylase gamma subunit
MNLQQVYVSAVAFLAVFVMLTILAGLMSILTRAFPGKPPERKQKKQATRGPAGGPEPELVAAVTAAVTMAVPGGRVTKIEEVK